MEMDTPLYSRSIATELGHVYVIGGYNRIMNMYLMSCYKWDEMFDKMEIQKSMIQPHADHSLCCVGGYIYVVGAFVYNQV